MSRPPANPREHRLSIPEITRAVTERFPEQLAAFREVLDAAVHERGWPTSAHRRWPRDSYEPDGAAIDTPDARVRIGYSFQDADDLGSFAPGTDPQAFRIHVHGYPGRHPDLRSSGSERIPLSRNESEGWVRAALPADWSDHAYELIQVDRPRRSGVPYPQSIYLVLVDGGGTPILAPDNMSWNRLWQGQFEPRKLEPNPVNTDLVEYLARFGPFVDTATIRDPRTDPDGGWRVEISGDDPAGLTPVARDTFDRACRSLRIRGAVTRGFHPLRIVLDSTVVHVHFHWKLNPNVFAMNFRLPQTEKDFRGPPIDSPGGVVSTLLMDWMEELDTGLVVRGTRTRRDGVLHIGPPSRRRSKRSAYGIGTVPLHERSGAWLATEGLHIDPALSAKDGVTLAAWIQAYENNADGRPFVGHAAAVWIADGIARIDVLEVVPGTPDEVLERLAFALTHRLADAGATRIDAVADHPVLTALGYRPGPSGGATLDVSTMP
ncbi:hypothetical protein ACWDUM_27895 [Rhodococcus sp. NPDC003322]